MYLGLIGLSVDATDIDHKVMHVRESLPVTGNGGMTLLYPQWETASHAPTAEVNALAGLTVTVDGRPQPWRRDPLDVFAFHVDPPPRAKRLDLEFDFVSATSPGGQEMEPDSVTVQWQSVPLYPAGWYARDLPVRASLRLQQGFTPMSRFSKARRGA